jgi:hypothetical protein
MRTTKAAALLALALVACGGGRDSAPVRADYLHFWDALLAAKAAADPDNPDLNVRAGGTLLTTLRANLANARSGHVSSRGHVEHDIRRVSVRGRKAVLVDCIDLDGMVLYDLRTSAVVPNQLADRPSQLVEYTLAAQGGAWVAVENRTIDEC